jgi:hypothetical protein
MPEGAALIFGAIFEVRSLQLRNNHFIYRVSLPTRRLVVDLFCSPEYTDKISERNQCVCCTDFTRS